MLTLCWWLSLLLAPTVNPSGGSASAFVPIEHAVLSREASAKDRTRVFARYSLFGALAGAGGALAASLPEELGRTGVPESLATEAMFFLYAILGICSALLYARVPRQPPPPDQSTASLGPVTRHRL
jgi:MFS family permease